MGKLSVFYLTILNLPPSQRSKLSSIFLMRVGHTADLKKHNAQLNFFEDFIQVLRVLANEGIIFDTDRGRERFFGAVMTVTGHSLAAHSLAGLKNLLARLHFNPVELALNRHIVMRNMFDMEC